MVWISKCFILAWVLAVAYAWGPPEISYAITIDTATTTVFISICGDAIVDPGEECDIPGETGLYSTTIVGRQCSAQCEYGPYCGDAVLQTLYDEECDDGNNADGDFCAADCTVENSAGGGGGSSGSGGGSSGGSDEEEVGDTQVNITGKAYPNATVNILLDGDILGTVRANAQADFSFSTQDVESGTNSFGFWANDSRGVRSTTLNVTFDVTQGAVTTISGVLLPPTISVDKISVARGEPITFSGKSAPNVAIATHIDGNAYIETTQTNSSGDWQLLFNTSRLTDAEHIAKARFEVVQGGKTSESNFSQALSFFVGVSPNPVISSSDLNRDGKVNLIDFSILIFWWGTDAGTSNPSADINGNNRVGLEDFSILLFNWTG